MNMFFQIFTCINEKAEKRTVTVLMLRIKPGVFPQKLFHHFLLNLEYRIISPNDKSIKKYN